MKAKTEFVDSDGNTVAPTEPTNYIVLRTTAEMRVEDGEGFWVIVHHLGTAHRPSTSPSGEWIGMFQ